LTFLTFAIAKSKIQSERDQICGQLKKIPKAKADEVHQT
jgi:hypothetical protein